MDRAGGGEADFGGTGVHAHTPAARAATAADRAPAPRCAALRCAQVVVVHHTAHGVDLPEDVASIEELMRRQRLA